MSQNQWNPASENQPTSSGSGGSFGGWSSVQPPQPTQGRQAWSGPTSQPTAEWTGQPAPAPDGESSDSVLGNLFDFSFARLMLPAAAGKLFMVVVVVIAATWLFGLLNAVVGNPGDAGTLIFYLLSSGAQALLWIILARVFIEGMAALVRLADKSGR